ncbi:MAG: helix-turn-helix domain-containing protein [Candidatus Hydrogenedens sp.]|nr:helix-turn-helix domain-containing protein [Candidatus Hydrogenedentota bacterium]NLF59464.1 helix-turn-helix domain-containing protein [Candidatus Hydrogenedens sp.]
MPDIAKVMKEEMQRLARKELKTALATLQKDLAALKKDAARQRRRIAALEKENRRLLRGMGPDRAAKSKPGSDEGKAVDRTRVTAKMIRALRARLGLSQTEFAKLAGVNGQSVYMWEHKEGRLTFRGGTKARVVALRKLTKKEARQKLDALAGE